MVIIKLQDGTDWFKANWIFRQLAKDTIATFPDDHELKLTMERSQALGGLFLDSMESDASIATLTAIRKVAAETLAGKIPGWKKANPEDIKGQEMYLRSIAELLDLINCQDNNGT